MMTLNFEVTQANLREATVVRSGSQYTVTLGDDTAQFQLFVGALRITSITLDGQAMNRSYLDGLSLAKLESLELLGVAVASIRGVDTLRVGSFDEYPVKVILTNEAAIVTPQKSMHDFTENKDLKAVVEHLNRGVVSCIFMYDGNNAFRPWLSMSTYDALRWIDKGAAASIFVKVTMGAAETYLPLSSVAALVKVPQERNRSGEEMLGELLGTLFADLFTRKA